MEQGGHHRLGVDFEIKQNNRYCHGVIDIRLTRLTDLVSVGSMGNGIGSPDEQCVLFEVGVVFGVNPEAITQIVGSGRVHQYIVGM